MSANPHNASLGLPENGLPDNELPDNESPGNEFPAGATAAPSLTAVSLGHSSSASHALGHEALQALLAFSSLHEQLRQRRAREKSGEPLDADVWQLEQFVLDEVLQLVAERALTLTGADGVAVAMAEGDAIVCRAAAGAIVPEPGARLDPRSGFSGACLRTGGIVRCDDTENDPRVNVQVCRRLGTRSIVAVPIASAHGTIGLLEAFSNEPYGFNDSDVRSLNLLAELVLSALRPEEEDRLTEISQRVVRQATVEPAPLPGIAPGIIAPGIAEVQTEPPVEDLNPQPESQSLVESSVAGSVESNSEIVAREDSKSVPRPLVLTEPEHLDRSRPGLVVVVAVVLLAVGLGAGLWWTLGHHPRPLRAKSSSGAPVAAWQAVPVATSPAQPTEALTAAAAVGEDEDQSDRSATTPEEAGVLPQVTGIRHWSSADSSTVVIDIQDQVQYEAHRLPNPERIYFDLHDTTLAAGFSARTITVNDALLQRVRVAQPMAGVTRVVLETKGASDFSVSLESNPYRLVVEVRKLGAKPRARAKVDLFAPMDSASLDQSGTSQVATSQPPADQFAVNQKPLNMLVTEGNEGRHPAH